MTPDLRSRVVEAGARAIHDYEEGPRTTRNLARAVLDAALDCLTENADEWNYAAMDKFPDWSLSDIGPRQLLAVLREPTDG